MVKIVRSFPAPSSLEREARKASGSYSEKDVVERLIQDFHGKCYICEMDELQDPQVEHLLPHKNGKYVDRKFDWNNLFLSCGHCNSVKKQQKYDEGIIDCCKEDPEDLISFKLQAGNVLVCAKNIKNSSAVLTAELVSEVFNLKNTGMRVYKSELRLQELTFEMNKLHASIQELEKNQDSDFALRKLKVLVKRKSRFAAFKRNYVRDNYPQYIDLL